MPKRKKPVNTNDLDHLTKLTEKMIKLNDDRIKILADAAELMKQINTLRLTTIPEFAAELGENGLKGWTMGDGSQVTIAEDMKVGIPEKCMIEALAYIKTKDKSAIIKTSIAMVFDGEDRKELDKLRLLLLKNNFIFSEKHVVNPATLKKFLGELRTAGVEDLNFKTFGIHDFKETKIKGVKIAK